MTNLQHLAEVAATLSRVSGQYNESLAEIELAINRLNLGVQCWIEMPTPALRLGYTRIQGVWGLYIDRATDETTWRLEGAPREYRIEAVSTLPKLLEHLLAAADAMLTRTADATHKARTFIDAINAVQKG